MQMSFIFRLREGTEEEEEKKKGGGEGWGKL